MYRSGQGGIPELDNLERISNYLTHDNYPMKRVFLTLFVLTVLHVISYSQAKTITGVITGENGESIPGVNVVIKGTTQGTITGLDGKYSIEASPEDTLSFSYIGYTTEYIRVADQTIIDLTLKEDLTKLDPVVVVGYGRQKKSSVVGAITQIDSDELKKSGGVSTVGQALQGKLPGVVSIFSNGAPGNEDMKVFIRGQSTWNNSGSPLVLVDGIERSMNDIDINEVESISVLKDASATAVYGVKGANGVILITTKRGKPGKAQLSINAETTFKTVSKLPEKLDAYESILAANESIERELMYTETSWRDYTPIDVAEKYRNQSTQFEKEVYPDIDWKDYQMKELATDYRLNLSVRGGNETATYFCNLSYLQENDMFKDFDNGKGYDGGYSFRRINYRSNLDYNITKTTKLSLNLSGAYGMQKRPNFNENYFYLGLYQLAPDIYYPRYEDGSYGFFGSNEWIFTNPLYTYSSSGLVKRNTFRLNSDFILDQDLKFITKGLSLQGKFSWDNRLTGNQSISDMDNVIFKRYINEGEDVVYQYPSTNNDYAYVIQPWTIGPMNLANSRVRRVNYQVSLNYNRTFGEAHNVHGLLLFKREKFASGSMFPVLYEDWVGRVTYNYDTRYFFEFNGAYNGSEKFGPGYRFELFPSLALGWMPSNESFLEDIEWLNRLKFRGSFGLVGDDGFAGRWQYVSQWASLNASAAINTSVYNTPANDAAASPYNFYIESVLGNPDLHWETSIKKDLGVELAAFKNRLTLEFDYFNEYRYDIVIYGDDRSIPDLFGNEPPDANLGEVEVNGYEFILGYRHTINYDTRLWTNVSYTSAKDKILYAEDPELLPDYLKEEGYPIGQKTSAIGADIMESWDDVYMSTPLTNGNEYKRVGFYDLVDYDGDGVYDANYDNTPYGYPTRPQKTWTWAFGGSYKNLSLSCQFYGMFNTTRNYVLRSFSAGTHLFFAENADYWSVSNRDATRTLAQYDLPQAASDPYRNLYDASMVRLKMVELAYDMPESFCNKIGIAGLRFYFNGNNLLLWTDMADDRDYNREGTGAANGDYPTLRRFNVGFNMDF